MKRALEAVGVLLGAQVVELQVVLHERGAGSHAGVQAGADKRVLKQSEITVRVDLHRRAAEVMVWTCDLSHDYVTINADCRS